MQIYSTTPHDFNEVNKGNRSKSAKFVISLNEGSLTQPSQVYYINAQEITEIDRINSSKEKFIILF